MLIKKIIAVYENSNYKNMVPLNDFLFNMSLGIWIMEGPRSFKEFMEDIYKYDINIYEDLEKKRSELINLYIIYSENYY